MGHDDEDTLQKFEALVEQPAQEKYILKLYVAGLSPRSRRAVANIKETCETHLKGLYELQVIDLYQHPTLAQGEQIIAAPTLVKELPLPLRRIVGDMSDEDMVLVGLDVQKARG